MGKHADIGALERIIATVAPRAALRRAQARAALAVIRGYEAASKGPRTSGWKTQSTSANSALRGKLGLLRDRARDLVRNNPYAARGVTVIASNVIGYGIKTAVRTPNKRNAPRMQEAFNTWAETNECDADGQHDIYGLQNLVMRGVVESGEMLVRRLWRTSRDGLTVPMQIRVMEGDFIDTSREGVASNGNVIIQGIEFDKRGRRVAYYLFDEHPGDTFLLSRSTFASRRVPADDVIHVYRQDRAGQVRGVSWFAPVVTRMREFDEYEYAQLVKQKVSACFTAFVYDTDTPEATGAHAHGDLYDYLEPAAIQRLPVGTNITFPTVPKVDGYGEYASVTLHAIAAGLGVPYEALTGDYSQVNFTSGRMGKVDFHANLDTWQWLMFIPQFCAGVFRWFSEAAQLAGLPAQGMTAKYTPPRRTLTDPTREVPAIIKSIRAGLQTMQGGIREMGEEPEAFLDEIEAWNREVDRRGIVLDTDPRRVTNGGQAQITPDDGVSVIDATETGGEEGEEGNDTKDAA